MDLIKTEYNSMCHGCFSNDRRMAPLGENSEIFLQIIGNQKQCLIYGTDDMKLCWECIAMLKKFRMFQIQLRKAQEVLIQFLYGLETPPVPLSKLTTTTKSVYDHEIQDNAHKKKGKIKNIISYHVEKDHVDIKTEVVLPEVVLDENKTEIIYADEANEILTNFTDNEKKPDFTYSDDVNNQLDDLTDMVAKDDYDVDQSSDFIYNFKMEQVKSEKKESKVKNKKAHKKEQWRTYTTMYKKYATLVETKQIDWGDIKTYFTEIYFDESDMEQHIFVKERIYTDPERYPFSCLACKLGYKSQMDLKRHNNLNHRKPGAPHKCSFCHKVLPSQCELEAHWRSHTPIAKCKLCGNVMRPRGMKQHLNQAHTKRYSCGYCLMTFETLSTFGAHYRDTHMKYTCDYCQKSFKSKSRLAYHIRNTHIPAYCVECDRSYLNRSQYQKHCILLHPERANRREASEAAFCVECDKQFHSIAQYRKHLKVSTKHAEIKRQSTPCPECGKIFARKLYMKNHYNLYHLKKTKFYCELCDKYFARAFGLRVHNTHVHQKVQRVRDKICDLCGRAFTNNRTMLNHRRTHTGERPHKCPHCSAEFIQKYAMQTHVRTQHKHCT